MPNEFSIVIPMYNEQDNVIPLLNEVIANAPKGTYEIVVVDDASQDNTYEALKQVQSNASQLKIVRHKKNFGQSAGILSGVMAAQYPWIITLDGDGQNDPADMKLFVETLEKNQYKEKLLLAGQRKERKDTRLKRISTKIANKIRGGLLRDNCPDSACGMKLFNQKIFLSLPHFNHMHRFLPAVFKQVNAEIINIPINHRPRIRGKSKYGINNRLWVGIIDLFGVSWLLRRACLPEVINANQ
ncbi:MAG: glycosyltransferase [Gammaproteobacteria bacterium]